MHAMAAPAAEVSPYTPGYCDAEGPAPGCRLPLTGLPGDTLFSLDCFPGLEDFFASAGLDGAPAAAARAARGADWGLLVVPLWPRGPSPDVRRARRARGYGHGRDPGAPRVGRGGPGRPGAGARGAAAAVPLPGVLTSVLVAPPP